MRSEPSLFDELILNSNDPFHLEYVQNSKYMPTKEAKTLIKFTATSNDCLTYRYILAKLNRVLLSASSVDNFYIPCIRLFEGTACPVINFHLV